MLIHYNLLFYMTDGSLFWSPARGNILIIQSPAHVPDISQLTTRVKLNSWHEIVCYSQFVKTIAEKELRRKIIVLPPPIEVKEFFPKKVKENIILSSGRFFSHLHSKRQDMLVDIFIKLCLLGKLRGWQLVLIGSVEDAAANVYLTKVKKKAKGYPIEIITNASFTRLRDYYTRAKIFWLATGFGQDLINHPERAEHFGIVTLEAMASGCVPIVFEGGAQPEIITSGKDGYLFQTENQLMGYTLKLAEDDSLRQRIANCARKRSLDFDLAKFKRRLYQLFPI